MPIDLVTAVAAKTLDGLFARQRAISQNVVNANSEGYTPVRVSFEDSLRAAAASQPGDTPQDALA
ncbi:hypothetical protein, partial [Clostridioides difficile]|uniref:hypothetical protein n=1 Tax=Clostridioides difficile TaxID=1496 RepID=UPI002ED37E30|nr:flagellar basal body rod protein FlgB [Clostridioides difficile]